MFNNGQKANISYVEKAYIYCFPPHFTSMYACENVDSYGWHLSEDASPFIQTGDGGGGGLLKCVRKHLKKLLSVHYGLALGLSSHKHKSLCVIGGGGGFSFFFFF